MDYLRRRLSTDASGEGGAPTRAPPMGALRGSALRSSISEGTSKIFSAVAAKKNGLISDISKGVDEIATKVDDITNKVDSVLGTNEDEDEDPIERSFREYKRRESREHSGETYSPDIRRTVPNGSVRQNGDYTEPPPLHRRESKESIAEKKDPMEKEKGRERSEPVEERDPNDPPFRVRRHSIVEDPPEDIPYRRESLADDFGFTTPEQEEMKDLAAEAEDTVPDEPVQVAGPAGRAAGEMRKIIHAMGDLISFDEDAFDRHSQSSDSEYGDGEAPVYERSPSACSDSSWTSHYSSESLLDEFSAECKEFMAIFVDMIFKKTPISQRDKARFGELAQHGPGRVWFARSVNSQRVSSRRVEEEIFYQLVQYFAVVLFECHEAEDFSPAKNLMNMCFTFYYEAGHGSGKTKYKHFLYSYLKDQPIWESLRFWNAAFFDAVQRERSRKPMCTSNDQREERSSDKEFQENITFGQLGTFTCNMRAFGLSKDLCLQFLKKQSTIANLREEQVNMLRENVEKWRE